MNGDEPLDVSYISSSELRGTARAVRPRDAATLLIVRREGPRPRVSMGRRAASHKFMPNKFVFPGGKVDAADSRIVPPHDLHPDVMQCLCRGCSQTRARALAAIRETYEETGLIIGEPDTPTLKSRSPHWVELSWARHMEGIPHITRLVLQELERRLRDGDGPEVCGPFMYKRYGRTVIEQI